MGLFQHSVLNKYLKEANQDEIKTAWEKLVAWFHNPVVQQNIRESKEEQFQEGFLTELFVKVFGYTMNPNPDYNLTTEYKNERGAKKADGAILKDKYAIGVIELKSTTTKDLEAIRLQAFDYKANQSKCVYVITSNFEKVRFYIHNAVEFEEFDLFRLTWEHFQLMWLCLAKENLLRGIPLQMKEASILKEENITKQIYVDYSLFKHDLYNDLVANNLNLEIFNGKPEKEIRLLLFKKSQKLLDRFLFILFSEDRGLLPPNSISEIIKQWESQSDWGDNVKLYDRYKKYFHLLNTGWKGKKHEIFAYNGGLFAPDEILDNVEISDETLKKHTEVLTAYDFETEVGVNILGHIFENSLNEIEEVTAELEGEKIDRKKSKRKKDGVFYTPKYITKYIVENTVGKLCDEKKTELGIDESEYLKSRKGRTTKKLKELDGKLDDYRKWLLTLTVCDPACGSGAFLNQALDFLIREHRYIDELQAKMLDVPMVFTEVENSILENNIYGVDINEESVEIAKLSLWLRTAQKGRKLTTLSNNIKCGNSLIDDPEIAGEKAFNWHTEFPEVFKNGGFDVVIGNPPYVRQELISKNDKSVFEKNYSLVFRNTADLYVYFYNKSIEILKSAGLLGFITPNKFIRSNYGTGLRQLLSKFQIQKIIDFGELPVFEDAATFPAIVIVRKKKEKTKTKYLKIESLKILDLESLIQSVSITLPENAFEKDYWILTSQNETKLLDKIRSAGAELGNKYQIKIGIKTGFNEAFVINETAKTKLINEDPKSAELIKRFAVGDNLRKYRLEFDNKYLILTKIGVEIEKYTAIFNHLKKYQINLEKRWDKGNYWYELRACDYYDEFESPKIVYPDIAKESRIIYDRDKTFFSNTTYFIPTSDKWLTGILNSKLVFYFYKHNSTVIGNADKGGRLRWFTQDVKKIPIPEINTETKLELEKLVDEITELNKNHLHEIITFKQLLEQHFSIQKFSKKLQNWPELEFKEFFAELKKTKVKLTLSEEAEWMAYFNEQKQKALALKSEIDKTDREIDQMVYELYGLTEEEIGVVEGNVK
jgi:type I restriction-modification system DNA methylase subunit